MTPEEAKAKVLELITSDHAIAVKVIAAVYEETAEIRKSSERYASRNRPYWAGMVNETKLIEEAMETACGLMDVNVPE